MKARAWSTAALGRAVVSGAGARQSGQSGRSGLPLLRTYGTAPSPTTLGQPTSPSLVHASPYQTQTPTDACSHTHSQRRAMHATAALSKRPYTPPRGKPDAGTGSGKPRGLPRDHDIKYDFVHMRRDDGSLSEPMSKMQLLSTLDPEVTSLVAIAMPSATPGSPDDGQLRYPVCKVVNVREERAAEAEKAREARKRALMSKELDFNWSIDRNDLMRWMDKLTDFLERGYRVDVRMVRRTRGKARRAATMAEAEELVRVVKATVAAVPGARQVKEMEGQLLQSATLVFEGPAPKKKVATDTTE